MHVDNDNEAIEDNDFFNGDVAMFDAVLTDTLRMNLTSRFDASVCTEIELPSTQDQSGHLQDQAQNHRHLATTTMVMTDDEAPTNSTESAPLNSRYNNPPSSAGASKS